jgi:hypothetical protein
VLVLVKDVERHAPTLGGCELRVRVSSGKRKRFLVGDDEQLGFS